MERIAFQRAAACETKKQDRWYFEETRRVVDNSNLLLHMHAVVGIKPLCQMWQAAVLPRNQK
jgi:hypothetical protein